MAKDNIHKLEAKFRQGLLSYDDAPLILKRKWNRSNFHIGRYRRLRRDKKSKDI